MSESETDNNAAHSSGSSSRKKRRLRPLLRQAPLILPKTGERVTRSFTLQTSPDSNHHSSPSLTDRSPLLGRCSSTHQRIQGSSSAFYYSPSQLVDQLKEWSLTSYHVIKSPSGINVLKCSLAYVVGSLATFVPVLSNLLGRGGGKHMVATVVVYFHPARSAGSMIEAVLLAFAAYLYAFAISLASMGVSVFFGKQDLVFFGQLLVLIVFCGGGLGLVGWTKQKLGNPLVNVACSLASLAIITVLTKEEAIHSSYFSFTKVYQVMEMVLMGVFASLVISFIIKPRSARKELRDDLVKITDHLEVFLTFITRGFLSGSNEDYNNEIMESVQKEYNSLFNSLIKNLGEAKFEHYVLGTERIHLLEVKLVKCIEQLAHDLDGLRSAASTQFELLKQDDDDEESVTSPLMSPRALSKRSAFNSMLEAIEEVSENPTPISELATELAPLEMNAADIFSLFISQLGPPMKSLAFTIKGVLNDLPFGPAPQYDIVFNENFIKNLTIAKNLFISSRKDALEALYAQRHSIKMEFTEKVAEYEEVAASCGYFSSSLEDFAEDTIVYLEILSDLKTAYDDSLDRSWNWMKFWRFFTSKRSTPPSQARQEVDEEAGLINSTFVAVNSNLRDVFENGPDSALMSRRPKHRKVLKYQHNKALTYRIWRSTAPLRREDVKFALKVGLGAIIYASFAFHPSTRPIYAEWRGEWGLLSYMLVCAMTIGASNSTGLQRFGGTCVGAIVALIAWFVSVGNAIALAFFGWLVSLACFWIIVVHGKGPLGRFVLLTYNLSALYAYSLSMREGDDDDNDEGDGAPQIWHIVLHRVVAVFVGCLWGTVVTRLIWPASARRKLKDGTSILWLRMGLIWKRDPLQMLIDGAARAPYMDIREENQLRRFLRELEGLRTTAGHEFDLRGPFPDSEYRKMLESTGRMLGSYHAMQVVIAKDLKATAGEAELLRYTREERMQLSSRICHLFSVLASSMKLEYPMNDSLPSIEHARDRFLAKLHKYRNLEDQHAKESDFELLFTYGLVTGQIAQEIEVIGRCIEQIYGVLNEDSLKLK